MVAEKDFITFDTETTGLSVTADQIIEITIQIGFGERAEIKTRRIKPTIPISKEASEVHGITDADLVDCPTFKQVGKSLKNFFEEAKAIVGYNVAFDLQILQSEFIRNDLEPLTLADKHILDPLRIWQKLKPKKLVDAYQEFCGKELIGAHSAEADVIATAEVYQAMLKSFKLDKDNLAEISAMSFPPEWIGLSRKMIWENGTPIFTFGKNSGKSVWSVINSDPSYLDWMKRQGFEAHVLEVCDHALNKNEKDFTSWISVAYPDKTEITS